MAKKTAEELLVKYGQLILCDMEQGTDIEFLDGLRFVPDKNKPVKKSDEQLAAEKERQENESKLAELKGQIARLLGGSVQTHSYKMGTVDFYTFLINNYEIKGNEAVQTVGVLKYSWEEGVGNAEKKR